MDGGRWAPETLRGTERGHVRGMGRPPRTMRGERGPGWLAVAWDGSAMAGRAIAGRVPSPAAPSPAAPSPAPGHWQPGAQLRPGLTRPTGHRRASLPPSPSAATVTTVTVRCHRETEAPCVRPHPRRPYASVGILREAVISMSPTRSSRPRVVPVVATAGRRGSRREHGEVHKRVHGTEQGSSRPSLAPGAVRRGGGLAGPHRRGHAQTGRVGLELQGRGVGVQAGQLELGRHSRPGAIFVQR